MNCVELSDPELNSAAVLIGIIAKGVFFSLHRFVALKHSILFFLILFPL